MDFKKLYRRILPVSKAAFRNDSEQKKAELKLLNDKLIAFEDRVMNNLSKQSDHNQLQQIKTQELYSIIERLLDEERKIKEVIVKEISALKTDNQYLDFFQKLSDGEMILEQKVSEIEKEKSKTDEMVNTLYKIAIQNEKYQRELIWANVFHDTIKNSDWLLDKTFSPGRWAVGYPCLYLLYRILDETTPKKILELGLGQSTKLISQYVNSKNNVEHIVVESDQRWIDFFCSHFEMPGQTRIMKMNYLMTKYKEAENVRVFEDFEREIGDKKFDLIFIDAPIGSDMKEFSRVDILSLLPNCLEKNFIIVIDDAERIGEKNTILMIKKVLNDYRIEYTTGVYKGEKDTGVICSRSNSYITTM